MDHSSVEEILAYGKQYIRLGLSQISLSSFLSMLLVLPKRLLEQSGFADDHDFSCY